jgi:FMN phosphatase YigB (HAD superfamily)
MIIKRASPYEALLIDLDGTLLDIDIEKFIPAYINLLWRKFNNLHSQSDFAGHLFGATTVMVENSDKTKKNKDVFYEEFTRRIGMDYEEIQPLVDIFYLHDFPGLSCWGREHPHARAVIETAKEQNLPLVLATNPIFPATAVSQRLKWGGLDESDFLLVTSMDNMHFCKPKADYYLEIAEKIGVAPDRCLMAGNDTVEDISATLAGMETFLVEDFILQRSGENPTYDYRGSLEELALFLKQV